MIQKIRDVRPQVATEIPVSPVARFLFADTRMAWLWLIVRLYCGYEWLTSGWGKVFGFSIKFGSFGEQGRSWVLTSTPGRSVEGFANKALAQDGLIGWYEWFLKNVVIPNAGVFAYLVAFGEVLVGLGLIVGALTGIAAFFGLFMNMNYMLAGAVSINPILATFAVLLMLAWRIAGYYGVDRYLLPLLGTPWWSGEWKRKTGSASTPSIAT